MPYYGYPPPPDDLLRPARWAAGLMFLLGGMLILMGGCLGIIGSSSVMNQLPPAQEQVFHELETQTQMPRGRIIGILAVVILIPGLTALLLGFFVRKGGRGSLITGLVLSSLIALWLAVNLLKTLSMGVGGAETAASLVMVLFALVIVGMTIYFLAGALRNVGRIEQMRHYYAQQWWQYQQQLYYSQQQQPPAPPPPTPPAAN